MDYRQILFSVFLAMITIAFITREMTEVGGGFAFATIIRPELDTVDIIRE